MKNTKENRAKFKVGDIITINRFKRWSSHFVDSCPRKLKYPITTKLLAFKEIDNYASGKIMVDNVEYGISVNPEVMSINKHVEIYNIY